VNCVAAIDLMDVALEGALPARERRGFDAHLGKCPPCRKYLQQLTVTVRSLGRLPRTAMANPRRAELLERYRRGARRPT
jgi:anti-sigma factor RsiW